jgi:hypothetical protein
MIQTKALGDVSKVFSRGIKKCIVIKTDHPISISYALPESDGKSLKLESIDPQYGLEFAYHYIQENLTRLWSAENGRLTDECVLSTVIPFPIRLIQNKAVTQMNFITEYIKKMYIRITELNQLSNIYINNISDQRCRTVRLGDICKFVSKSQGKLRRGNGWGKYTFFNGTNKLRFIDTPDFFNEASALVWEYDGNLMVGYCNTFSCTPTVLVIQSNLIDIKFIYHYLRANMQRIRTLYDTVNEKISLQDIISELLIDCPSVESIISSIKYCDNNDMLVKESKREIEANENMLYMVLCNSIQD